MEHAYASALWKMIADGTDVRKAVYALRENLATNGRSALLPRIARAILRVAGREQRTDAATLFISPVPCERQAKSTF